MGRPWDANTVTPPPTPKMRTPPITRPHASSNVSKGDHYAKRRIHKQTRPFARYKSSHAYITSSRGFHRELPPMQAMQPAPSRRRYSADVITKGLQDEPHMTFLPDSKDDAVATAPTSFSTLPKSSYETDEPVSREPVASFPNPRRYHELVNIGQHLDPPKDDGTYLELQKSSLTNEDFWSIIDLNFPNVWFRDTVLDAGLEIVSLRYNVEKHKIAIANSLTAQLLFGIGAASDVGDNDYSEYAEYKRLFENKEWIFVPVNNGMLEQDAADIRGNHWSLIAIDRRNKIAHYVDSLYIRNDRFIELAHTLATGIGRLLGDVYLFVPEQWSPHQWDHNKYKNAFGPDRGPCGPFVVTMVALSVQVIIQRRERRAEADFGMTISQGFPEEFHRLFDSFEVRLYIGRMMVFIKTRQEAKALKAIYDAEVRPTLDSVEVVDEVEESLSELVQSAVRDLVNTFGEPFVFHYFWRHDDENLFSPAVDNSPESSTINGQVDTPIARFDDEAVDIRLSPEDTFDPTWVKVERDDLVDPKLF